MQEVRVCEYTVGAMAVLRVLPQGIDIELQESRGTDLLELLTARGIPLESECGGEGTCGKCLVELVEGVLLDIAGGPASPVFDRSYLACRCRPGGDCVIRVEPAARARPPGFPGLLAAVEAGARPPSRPGGRLGVAVDVGTTTVVALLADLDTGAPLAVESETNPQRAHGADVVSRIAYSLTERDGASGTRVLRDEISGCVDELIGRACGRSGRRRVDIRRVVCAGNTAMQHFLLGVTPRRLGTAPYEAEFREADPRAAGELGLEAPNAVVHVLPNIGSFIGADTVACLLAIEETAPAGYTVMIDLGTNTEMVLGSGRGRTACSAAAGPAFEGAHLEHGMRALPGAVSRVEVNGGALTYRTIADAPASGICGSGIVDAVAALRRIGVVEADGKMPGGPEYVIVPAAESATGRAVTVTRKDIREIQLVKGSIATGLKFLVEDRGVGFDEIEAVYVAGAFGNYLDIGNARGIGLLPDLPLERFKAIGDAALEGAYLCMIQGEPGLERARRLALETERLELAGRPEFQRVFIGSLRLAAYRSAQEDPRGSV